MTTTASQSPAAGRPPPVRHRASDGTTEDHSEGRGPLGHRPGVMGGCQSPRREQMGHRGLLVGMDVARPDLDHLSAAVVLCPPGDLHGLTPLDLRVLGLLVEGVTDMEGIARALHVARDTVVDSLGRSLAALRTSDLTAATVRALRGGLRIPPGAMRPT